MTEREFIVNLIIFILFIVIVGIGLRLGSGDQKDKTIGIQYSWNKCFSIGFIYTISFYILLGIALFITKHFMDKTI